MTLLHFSFKLLEILLYCQKICKVIPKGGAVNLKEGMSNLFLFPILQECASTIFLNLFQIRGWASPLTCVKLVVPSGKYQRGEFVYLLGNVPIQIFAIFFFFHNFRGLKWIPLQKRIAPNFKTTTLAHSRLSLVSNNNNTH